MRGQRDRHRRRGCPWTSGAGSPSRCRTGPAPTSSRPTPGSSATSRPRAASCATTATSTTTPYCWRTDTPIIYRAINSWYVQVTAIRDRLSELNQQINWVPDHVRDGRFGMWLGGARDWSISRNRFWGSPIPVWRSDDPAYPRMDVYGSLDELERDFGVRPDDLHRALHRRSQPPQPRRPHRPVCDAAGAGGAGLLVRVGLHALRAGPLPVREHRVVREPLPGRLHRGVHQPDTGLVLHAARAGRSAVRPARLLQRDLPRHPARRRRDQAGQEAAQLHRARPRSSSARAPTPCAGT